MEDSMAKVKEMLLPKDPRYLKYPLEAPFDQDKAYWIAAKFHNIAYSF